MSQDGVISIAIVALFGCASHTWAPGPDARGTFDETKGRCSLLARNSGGAFAASGNAAFVAGAATGNAIGNAITAQNNFNDCMLASGWVVADHQPANTPPQPQSQAQRNPGTSGSSLAVAQPLQASAYAEPSVPNMLCTSADVRRWDNCVGTFTYPNGNVYRGEYHHGMREGFGVININARGISDENNILSDEQSMYIGEFRSNRLNGHGVLFTASGTGYADTFVNNIPQSDLLQRNCNGPHTSALTNCVAEFTYPNGNVYKGEFVQGQRQGVGLIEIHATGASDANNIRTPMPGIYVGEFLGDRLNGRGVIIMQGSAFYGRFTNNIFLQ
jgi:hypothetical protein